MSLSEQTAWTFIKDQSVQISAIQTDVTFGDVESNLNHLRMVIEEEAVAGSELVVFPECFLTGYCCDSLDEAMQFAETIPGPSTEKVAESCGERNLAVVFGMLERAGDQLFNTAVLVNRNGVVGSYRKTHLPWLGVDRFTTPGTHPYEVFDVGGLRMGMLICYDGGFPEPVRALSLAGADLVVLPTNWPPGAESMAVHAVCTRAMENNIYFAAVNRVGTERGFTFIGESSICDPAGNALARVAGRSAGVIRAEIDVAAARNKRIVRVPEKHVIDRMADRRPELYGSLCEAHGLSRPGRDD